VGICSLPQKPKTGPGYYQSSLLIPITSEENNNSGRRDEYSIQW
jgi:hypothetical protein